MAEAGHDPTAAARRRLIAIFVLAIGLPAALLVYGNVRAIEADREALALERRRALEARGRELMRELEAQLARRTRRALEALAPRRWLAELQEHGAGDRPPPYATVLRRVRRFADPARRDPVVGAVFVLDPALRPVVPPERGRSASTGTQALGLEALEARARVARAFERARALAAERRWREAEAIYTRLAADPADLEAAARARLALAQLLVRAGREEPAKQQLAVLARLPATLRTREGLPVCAVAARLAAELEQRRGAVGPAWRARLDLYERLLAGACGPLEGALAKLLDEIEAALDNAPAPDAAAGQRFERLRARRRWLEGLERRWNTLRRELPELVLALRAAPPPVGVVTPFTIGGALGPRLMVCVRQAPREGGPAWTVGYRADLDAIAEHVLAPALARQAEATGLRLAVLDRARRPIVVRGGPPAPGARPVAVAFETLVPSWRLQLTATEPLGDRAAWRLAMQLGGLALLVVVMVAGARWAIVAAVRSLDLAERETRLVETLSHELRTPLASIRMYAELLERLPPEAASRRRRYLETLLRETARLEGLVEDVLAFARARAGAAGPREAIEIGPLLEEVLGALRARLELAGAELQLRCEPGLPVVPGDGRLVRAAVRNLVLNALAYSPPDRVRIAVSAQRVTDRGREAVAIEVRDEGFGIAAEELPRVQQRFYRGEAARRLGVPGSGLGLALVQQAARSHGGRLEIRSRPGEGTCVRLVLPVEGRAVPERGGSQTQA